MKRTAAAALGALALLFSSPAHAAPGLLLGVDDDSLKWYARTSSLVSIYDTLDLGAVRVTLQWSPGETFPSGSDRTELQRVASASNRIRIVLAVVGPADEPPVDEAGRASYCGFVANVLRRYPAVHDVAIWTEPNAKRFWQPQHGAAASYESLLAACWDAAHAAQPAANVIATSAPHSDPAGWYRAVGAAYRASLRAQRIFDTVGHNAYPDDSSESPSAVHRSKHLDEGDLAALLTTLRKAFRHTGQPAPGSDGVTVWYLEDGFQSSPGGGPYAGVETDRHPVSEERQAEELRAAAELAYCQPAVGAFFNFELRDDASLAGWQSGLVRPDWSAKPAFTAYAAAAREIRDGTVVCSEAGW